MVLQMKFSIPYFIAGVLVLLVFGQSYTASGQTVPIANHVVINEVELNPVGDSTALPLQWVELYNPTNSPVNIGGWSIGATTGLQRAYTVSLGTSISSHQFIVYNYVANWLPQAGAVIQLKGSDGTIIDQTPPLTDTQGDGNTWQRLYDGYDTGSQNDWVFKSGTPGSSNGAAPTSTTTSQLGMSVSTDKQNYIFGDIVNIGGQVSQIVNNPAVTSIPTAVNLIVSGPNGFSQTFSLYPGTDFKFSTYVKTNQILGFTEGTYTISASYGNAQASSTFSLGSTAFVPPAQIAPTTMVISPDRSNYTISQPIVLTGTVSTVIPLTPVQFKVYDPTSTVVYQGTLFPDSQGKLTTVNQYQSSAASSGLLINSINPVYGIYRLTATYGGTSAFATFALIPAQVQNSAILMSTDKKAYAPGETVMISGSTMLQGLQNLGLNPSLQIIQTTFGGSSGTITSLGNRGIVTNSINMRTLVNLQSDNTFTYQFVIPGTSVSLGNYRAIVSIPQGIAEADFVVVQNPSNYTSAISQSSPFSIVTNKNLYAVGEQITISGNILNPIQLSTQNAAASVVIQLLNSTGLPVVSGGSFINNLNVPTSNALFYSAFPDANGNFQVQQQTLQRGIFLPGTYTLKASYSHLSASTTFTVYDPLLNNSTSPISASTDKNVYGVGDTVQLNGQISSSVGTSSYTLTLVRPSGNQITFPLQVNNGQFSWTWTIPQTDTTGSAVITTDRSASSAIDLTRTVYGIYRITISSTQANSALFFQVSKNPQPNQSLSPITVNVDKTNYLSTDVARIWGQVIPIQNPATAEANAPVNVVVYSNGQQAYQGVATVNQGGQYYITIPFHPGIWTNGTYNLYVRYLTNQATTSFSVSDPFSASSGKLRLIMITDSDKYIPGQTVLITGRTSSIISIQNVDLAIGMANDTTISEGQVMSLKGVTIPSTTVPFDQYGSFSYDYKIPNNAKLGNYTLVAQVPFGSFNAYFNVVNQLPVQNIPTVTNQTQTTPTNATEVTSVSTTIPSTIGPVEKHVQSTNMFVEKTNQIPDSVIAITMSAKSVGNLTYYPRQLDGLLRVNPGDENNISIMVSSQNGTCIIGQDSNCLVTQSTVQSGKLYQTVVVDGKSFLVGYSGTGLRLQQFSVLPAATNDVIPDGQWNINVLKKDQVTRFYYQVTYVGK